MSLKTKPRKPVEARVSAAEQMLRHAAGLMLSSAQMSRLRHASRLEGGSWSDKAEAQTIVAQVKAELAAGMTETIALEEARGGEVLVLASGAAIVSERDGLFSLLRITNPITAEQWDAGMAFRAGWEKRSADVGSQMGAGEGGGAHDNNHFVAARYERAMSTNLMNNIRLRVAQECKDEPACLQMLQWVAGDGHSIRAFGGGRSFERNLKALKRALDVAGRRT